MILLDGGQDCTNIGRCSDNTATYYGKNHANPLCLMIWHGFVYVSVIDQDHLKRRKAILIECGANTFLLILNVSAQFITM